MPHPRSASNVEHLFSNEAMAMNDRVISGTGGWWIALLAVCCGGAVSHAQLPEVDPRILEVDARLHNNPSAYFASALKDRFAIADLPAAVLAPEGQLTLWADFAHPDAQGVPLYLVNRTGAAQEFFTQDGDPYIMLEYQDASGAWKRAQAHLSSWCGNSYGKVSLPPRQYFLFHGYHVAQGKACKIRYACLDSTKIHPSQEAQGFISEADLAVAAMDSIAAHEAPQSILGLLALPLREELWTGATAPPELKPGARRTELRPQQPLPRRVEAVRALAWMEKNEPAIMLVHALQKKIQAAPATDTTREALQAIDDVLAHAWQAPIAPNYLLHLSLARVKGGANLNQAVMLPSAELAWGVLGDVMDGRETPVEGESAKAEAWKPVIAAAVGRVLRGEDEDRVEMGVLSSKWLLDSFVTHAELEDWLKSSNEKLQLLAAATLAQRSSYERLAELALASHLSPVVEVEVLVYLAYSGAEKREERKVSARQPSGAKEVEFWTRCMQAHPLEAANALWDYGLLEAGNPFNRIIHDPVHAYFEGEAARGVATGKDFEISGNAFQLRMALEFLGSWKLAEDTPLLQKLLLHRGYEVQTEWAGFPSANVNRIVKHRYVLREAAADALLAMKVALPPNTVLAREVTAESKPAAK